MIVLIQPLIHYQLSSFVNVLTEVDPNTTPLGHPPSQDGYITTPRASEDSDTDMDQ